MNRTSEWRGHALAGASIALLALLLLAPFAVLDPARGMSFSPAPFSDEGWNLVGAHNLVVFGQPATDEWTTWLLAVPFMVIEAAAMAIFGLDLVVARLVLISCVALTGAAIAWLLAPAVGTARAWAAGVAFVTSALVLYYGRLAFLEPMVGLFLALGILSIVPATRSNAFRWGIAGGLAIAFAVMTKGVAGPAGMTVVAVVLVAASRARWARRWLLGAIPVGVAIAAAWGLFVLWPHRDEIRTVVTVIYPPYVFPTGIRSALKHLSTLLFRDGLGWYAVPLLLLALAGAIRITRSCLRARRADWPADDAPLVAGAAALAALVVAALTLGIVDYQPNRYAVAFLPIAAIVGAWAIPDRLLGVASRRRAWLVAGATAVTVAVQGLVLHAGWVSGARTDVARMQSSALASLPRGATVVGRFAPLVALGAPVRTVVPFETVNDDDWYALGARYLMWVDTPPAWMADHPTAWSSRRTIACMEFDQPVRRTCLYELPDGS